MLGGFGQEGQHQENIKSKETASIVFPFVKSIKVTKPKCYYMDLTTILYKWTLLQIIGSRNLHISQQKYKPV